MFELTTKEVCVRVEIEVHDTLQGCAIALVPLCGEVKVSYESH